MIEAFDLPAAGELYLPSATTFLLDGAIADQAQRDRTAQLRRTLAEHDVGAALIFDSVNVRYACGIVNMQLNTSRNPGRYVFVPVDGPIVLFEYTGCIHMSDGSEFVDETRPAHAIHPQYANYGPKYKEHLATFVGDISTLMRRHSPDNNRIAIDRATTDAVPALIDAGYEIVDGHIPIDKARARKSDAELELVRASMRGTEAAVAHMEQNIVPGRSEMAVWSVLNQALIAGGGEYCETRLMNSGLNTNPWFQECSAKPIEAGELVALDTDAIGCHGYYSDFSRTFLAGDGKATGEQQTLYRTAQEQLEHNIDLLRTGLTFREFAEQQWQIPEIYAPNRYLVTLHGMGLAGEYPLIGHLQDWDATGDDGVFESNMTLCIEAFIGRADGGEGVKLEEHVILTDDGVERLSQYPFDDRLGV